MKLLRDGPKGRERAGARLAPPAPRPWLEVDGHRCRDRTPAGVGLGQTPPAFLRAGRTVRLGIDGPGVRTQRFVDAA